MDWVVQHRSHAWTVGFRFISFFGEVWFFLLALVIFTGGYFFRRQWRQALYFVVGLSFLKGSVSIWKMLVARPRPLGGLETLESFAMPSGHAATAVIFFGLSALAAFRLKHPALRYLAILSCGLAIVLIGLSRVYLGVHYPSDVLLATVYTASGLALLIQPRLRRIFAASTISSSGSSPRSHF